LIDCCLCSRAYLAHHELESNFGIVIIVVTAIVVINIVIVVVIITILVTIMLP